MTIPHSWNPEPQDAAELQQQLSAQVIRKSSFTLHKIRTVAGIYANYQDSLGTVDVVLVNIQNFQSIN